MHIVQHNIKYSLALNKVHSTAQHWGPEQGVKYVTNTIENVADYFIK